MSKDLPTQLEWIKFDDIIEAELSNHLLAFWRETSTLLGVIWLAASLFVLVLFETLDFLSVVFMLEEVKYLPVQLVFFVVFVIFIDVLLKIS